jgi:hypothetical protein
MSQRSIKVGIALAVFQPNLDYLKVQLESISKQTYSYSSIVVGIDELTVDPEVERLISILPNSSIIKSHNQGSIKNFERLTALLLEQSDIDLIFFSDQDDIWEANKIEAHVELAKQVGESPYIIHSDLSSIDSQGRMVYSSVFQQESRSESGFEFFNHILRNNVTGCSMSVHRDLAALSLPFPAELPSLGVHHDAWINAIAGVVGITLFTNAPLVRYRSHEHNQIGILKNEFRYRSLKSKIISYRIRRQLVDLVIDRVLSRHLDDINLSYSKFRDSPINFLLRNLKRVRSRRDRKLYFDFLIGAVLSKAVTAITIFKDACFKFLTLSKLMSQVIKNIVKIFRDGRMKSVINKLSNGLQTSEPLVVDRLAIETVFHGNEIASIILLVPHLPPEPIFGGISTGLEFAIALAEELGKRLVLVSTNQKVKDSDETSRLIRSRFKTELEIIIKDPISTLFVGKTDTLIATAWWTAEFIVEIERRHDESFSKIYLIQDFEPNFYAWSTNYARALSTYSIKSMKVFNTSLLKDYFVSQNLANVDDHSLQPVISWGQRSLSRNIENEIRVIFYFRPSVARNMASLTIESLEYFVKHRTSQGVIRFVSIGEHHPTLKVAGIPVKSFGHLGIEEYKKLLSEQDIGLSLMLSPHPSYPPLDMVASGVVTVTNSYANKVEGSIPLLEIVSPQAEALGEALIRAEDVLLQKSRLPSIQHAALSAALGEYTMGDLVKVVGKWI